ncbi:hypothetical protein ACFL1G_00110 [Planctomycetota bacterium]
MKQRMKMNNNWRFFNLLLGCLLISAFSLLNSCAVVEFITPEGPPSDQQLVNNYQKVMLRTSSAADVLVTINLPEYELLSQSKSVIASAGEKKKGYKKWCNIVAFDENTLAAKRKYLCITDERPKALFADPWERLQLSCELIQSEDVLDKPYADENAALIAVLRQVLTDFQNDIKEVGSDNEVLAVFKMMVNQAVTTALQRLEDSPAEAALLSTTEGLQFEHISFDKGNIRMMFDGDIVIIDLQLGSVLKKRVEWTGKIFEYKD